MFFLVGLLVPRAVYPVPVKRERGAPDAPVEQRLSREEASVDAISTAGTPLTGTRHTPECLAVRLKELEAILYHCFPAYAADCGLDAARQAGMRYIRRVREGTACDLDDGEAYLRLIAFRAARRCQRRE